MATSSVSKRKRVGYTLEFKMKVLEEVDRKQKKADICSEFGIPKSTLNMFIIPSAAKDNKWQHETRPCSCIKKKHTFS